MLKLKHFLVIIPIILLNIFLLIISVVRTDKTITLPGNLVDVSEVIEVEDNNVNGSYSTIYVISFDKSTWLQNFIVNHTNEGEVETLPQSYLHFSMWESYMMGKIQYEEALNSSIICAYLKAKENNEKIVIDYKFISLYIGFYKEGTPFKIGDEIIAINNVISFDNYEVFKDAFNNRKPGDSLTIVRDDKTLTITLDENNINSFGIYKNYEINYDTLFPKIDIKKEVTLGPSGGFLRALSLYDSLITTDLAKGLKITGTGTIDLNGNVGVIGGIKEKIYTAYHNDVDIFFCPSGNYEEALEAYNKLINPKMKLYKISNINEAIEVLLNV